MKIILSVFLSTITIVTSAQKNKVTVGKAENVIFRNGSNGTITIQKADTVIIGKIIINSVKRVQFKVASVSQNQDTLGNFTTVIKFINPESKITTDVLIVLEFDNQVESVNWRAAGISQMVSEIRKDDNKGHAYRAASVMTDIGLEATIISKTKIFTTISGVDGYVN